MLLSFLYGFFLRFLQRCNAAMLLVPILISAVQALSNHLTLENKKFSPRQKSPFNLVKSYELIMTNALNY